MYIRRRRENYIIKILQHYQWVRKSGAGLNVLRLETAIPKIYSVGGLVLTSVSGKSILGG